jgi:SAM-dependent methyltransferase
VIERRTEVFGRAAVSYGAVGPDLFGYFGARVVDVLELTSGSSLLDVGCGTGAVLEPAASAIGPRGAAVGIDRSAPMAAQAHARGHLVAMMDARELAFPAGVFDAVVANFVLTYFTEPPQVLVELRRVLRAGGRLGLVVHDGWWWQDDPRWAWHRQLVDELGNDRATAQRRFEHPAAVVAVVRQAGFSDADAVTEQFVLRWAGADEWWAWCWSHGYRAVLEAFDSRRLNAYREACFDHLRPGPVEATLPVMVTRASSPS